MVTEDKWTKRDIVRTTGVVTAAGSCAIVAATSAFAPIRLPAMLGFFGGIYCFRKLFQ